MACAMCEHCLNPITADETVIIREGFSYHKSCLKCYVCSETNLHNAEVFKGVIFCSSCAQRIFQSCASVRRNKQFNSNRVNRAHFKPRRKHARPKAQEKKVDKPMNRVIELARLAGSSTGSNDSRRDKPTRLPAVKKPSIVTQLALQVAREVLNYSDIKIKQSVKKDSVDMGVTTEVTQDIILKQINIDETYVNSDLPTLVKSREVSPARPRKRRKDIIAPKTYKPICSDLRMAELGASTEIANMTLRKRSEMPVVIKSTTEIKETKRRIEENDRERQTKSCSVTVLQQDTTDMLEDGNISDSAYSTYNSSIKTTYLDRRLGSILKLPYNFFKTNILNRSSLISVLMSSDEQNKNTIIKRFKTLFFEEITEHQGRGIRRLYSTINRRKTPYKLGWLNLKNMKSISRERMRQLKSKEEPEKKCKHLINSHSYRCMRAKAMRLAGPTRSQLACVRRKIKRVIAPKVVRDILKCLCDVEDPLPTDRNRNYDLETVFKAQTSSEISEKRKIHRNENKLRQLGERYANLWSVVV